jgi:D-arginine dehydrogenase
MADVAIVGAGLIGTGIAFELAKRGASVVVFDRDEPVRAASWAGAGMLAPFSEALPDVAMLALCRASLEAYPAFAADLLERTGVDVKLQPCGTLHVALDAASLRALHDIAPAFARNGGDVQVLDRAATLAREPAVARTVAGALFIANEAQVDNRRLGRALVAACERLGVRFERSGELALEADVRRVRGLRSARGFVPAGIVVNAAGAWAGEIGRLAGAQDIGLQPLKRTVCLLDPPPGAHSDSWPMMVDVDDQFYLKPDAGKLLLSPSDETPSPPCDAQADEMDIAIAVDRIERATTLTVRHVAHKWAGLRSFVRDQSPVVGYDPLQPGFFWLAALGGYGIQTAPALGSLGAALALGMPPDEALLAFGIDPAVLRPDRLLTPVRP